jgi:DNA-binding LytR/AlgR family response regulator
MKIAIIDDIEKEAIKMKNIFEELGYHNLSIFFGYNDAHGNFNPKHFDLIVLDYRLENNKKSCDLLNEAGFDNEVPVVFITEYYNEENFIKTLKYDPVCFLSKPLDIIKVLQLMELIKTRQPGEQNVLYADTIFVKSTNQIVKIHKNDILFFKSDAKYQYVITENKRFIIRQSMKLLEKELLPDFLRVNIKYIVNVNKVDSVDILNNEISIGEFKIPLSRNYKTSLLEALRFIQ